VTGNTLLDGAEFIDCALKAGELPQAICRPRNGIDDYDWAYYRIDPLYDMLRTLEYTIITDEALIRPGDIAIVGDGQINPELPNFTPNRACWMGIVLPSKNDPAVMHIAAHSVNQLTDQIDIVPSSMSCGNSNQDTATRIYMRLITDETRPMVAFTQPAPGRFAYGAMPTLRWLGIDEVDGSGIQGYTLRRKVNAGAWQDLLTLQPVTERIENLNQPCNTVLYEITAIDNAGNPSLPATLTMSVGLQGDFDLNGMVDSGDTQLVDAAWGLGSRSENFDSRLDITGDGNINAADLTWMHLHQGDRCAN